MAKQPIATKLEPAIIEWLDSKPGSRNSSINSILNEAMEKDKGTKPTPKPATENPQVYKQIGKPFTPKKQYEK